MTDPGPWRGTDPSACTISSKVTRWLSGTLSLVAIGSLATVRLLTRKRVVVVRVADHVLCIQIGDLFLGVAQETQHLLVVLAHLGRGANDSRSAAEVPEVTGHGDRPGQEIGDLHHRTSLPRVRILRRLRNR